MNAHVVYITCVSHAHMVHPPSFHKSLDPRKQRKNVPAFEKMFLNSIDSEITATTIDTTMDTNPLSIPQPPHIPTLITQAFVLTATAIPTPTRTSTAATPIFTDGASSWYAAPWAIPMIWGLLLFSVLSALCLGFLYGHGFIDGRMNVRT